MSGGVEADEGDAGATPTTRTEPEWDAMANASGRGVEDGVGGRSRVGDKLREEGEEDAAVTSLGFLLLSHPATTPS
jgi:hypothetical protein